MMRYLGWRASLECGSLPGAYHRLRDTSRLIVPNLTDKYRPL